MIVGLVKRVQVEPVQSKPLVDLELAHFHETHQR